MSTPTKNFTIKHWVEQEYVTLYPKTTGEQIIQDTEHRLVSDAQIASWSGKQDKFDFVPENSANKGKADGYASLDGNGKLLATQLPKEATTEVFEENSQENMLRLDAQKGDICIRKDQHKTYILGKAGVASEIDNWILLETNAQAPVQSVNGKTGAVVLTAQEVGAVSTTQVSDIATPGKLLKVNEQSKLPVSITGDAATVGGKTVNDGATNNASLWTAHKINSEIKNAVAGVVTSLDWKESVETFDDLEVTYPEAEDGWTVNVKDNDVTYRYSGDRWIPISANAIPIASGSVDGKMSAADKRKLDGIAANANNYVHPESHAASMITEDSERQFVSAVKKQQYDENTLFNNETPILTDLGGITVGTTFDNMPVKELLTKLLYPYIAPQVTFATEPVIKVKEKGDPVTELTLKANTVKKSKQIIEVKFYSGEQVIHTVDGVKADGGAESFKLASPLNETKALKVTVSDGQTVTTSDEITISFVYPMYIGNVKVASPDEGPIRAMSKLVANKPTSYVRTPFTTDNGRFCFAYPEAYGNLKSITDVNGFELINEFNKEVKEVQCLDGTRQRYNVYTFKNVVTMNDYSVTFKFQ